MAKSKNKLKIIPLGGLNEIGKNLTVLQFSDEMIIIDCGLTFPDDELYGVDLVIPDMTYLERNKDLIKGIILTHGHEDHIGAVPYALRAFNVPVYGTKLTLGILKKKLEDYELEYEPELIDVNAGDTIELGCFNIEFIRTNHSITDSVALAIRTPIGLIVHTGDFKIDYTPICGEPIDLTRFSDLGKEGVLLLMSDSTNADEKGYTESERVVGQTFHSKFLQAKGRILVATFSTNIHRIQQVIETAEEFGRKVAVCGRSMENVMEVARDLGYMHIKDSTMIGIDEISNYPENRLVILTTGSQGEPMSALTRIASGTHRKVKLMTNDMVIISASPIPGNEKFINYVINDLLEQGAQVVYTAFEDVHVSGHACAEELKLMLALTKPKYFMPVHGEYKHLSAHAAIAKQLGIPSQNIAIIKNGQILEVRDDIFQVSSTVPTGELLVDGAGVGDIGNVVIKDRKRLAEEGIIIISITIDSASGQLVAGPDIITRGFIYSKNAETFIDYLNDVVFEACDKVAPGSGCSGKYKSAIRDAVSDCVSSEYKRFPLILPVVLEI